MGSKDTNVAPTNLPTNPEKPSIYQGAERKALIDEIVNEMSKDAIKVDALAQLKKADLQELISKFFQHPAVLLIVGFALTGLIGAYLTNRWQSQEWEREQLRTLEFRGFDQKYEIIDEITKSVGERNSAAIAVVAPLLQGVGNEQLIRDEAEAIKDWRKASNEWLVRSKILQLKIETRIKSKEASLLFAQIAEKEANIGVDANLLQTRLVEYNWMKSADNEKKTRAKKRIDGILSTIQATGEDLKKLVVVIADEARGDVKSGKR